MINLFAIDELAKRLAALVPENIQHVREDLRANFRDILRSGLRELELVTREEFDLQRSVLLRTRAKIDALEQQIDAIEAEIRTSPAKL